MYDIPVCDCCASAIMLCSGDRSQEAQGVIRKGCPSFGSEFT